MTARPLATILLAGALVGGFAPTLTDARQARKPLGQMTCEDFLLVDDAAKPEIVYWVASRSEAGTPAKDVPDVDATDSLVPVLVEHCRATPAAPFWHTVKSQSDKLDKKL
jgi:acid stress chaperone HdeA